MLTMLALSGRWRSTVLCLGLAIFCLGVTACGSNDSTVGKSALSSAAQEFSVQSGAATLYARTIGGYEGSDALVLLHGGPGISCEYMATFDRLASPTLRLVTYDQQGVGQSPATASFGYTANEYVADLEAVRASLGVERIHILGHSWGGFLALAYVTAHPDHVASLTLVDGMPPTGASFQAGEKLFLMGIASLQAEKIIPNPLPPPKGDDCGPPLAAYLPVYFYDPAFVPPPELVASQCNAKAMDTTFGRLGNYDLNAQLRAVTAPVFVLFGAADPFGAQWQKDLVSAFSAAQPEQAIIPKSGHFPWLEQPEPSFAKLTDFLTRRAHLTVGTPKGS